MSSAPPNIDSNIGLPFMPCSALSKYAAISWVELSQYSFVLWSMKRKRPVENSTIESVWPSVERDRVEVMYWVEVPVRSPMLVFETTVRSWPQSGRAAAAIERARTRWRRPIIGYDLLSVGEWEGITSPAAASPRRPARGCRPFPPQHR